MIYSLIFLIYPRQLWPTYSEIGLFETNNPCITVSKKISQEQYRWSLFRKNTSAENHCKNKDPHQNDDTHTANRSLYPAAFEGLRYSTGNR